MIYKKEEKQNQDFFSKVGNFFKKSASATAGATAGALIGSFIPVVGTFFGGIIGAVIGRALESVANFVFGVEENHSQTIEKPSSFSDTLVNTSSKGAANTLDMTLRMGGPQLNTSASSNLIEAPVLAPSKQTMGSIPLSTAFFDKSTQSQPVVGSALANPGKTPTLSLRSSAA